MITLPELAAEVTLLGQHVRAVSPSMCSGCIAMAGSAPAVPFRGRHGMGTSPALSRYAPRSTALF